MHARRVSPPIDWSAASACARGALEKRWTSENAEQNRVTLIGALNEGALLDGSDATQPIREYFLTAGHCFGSSRLETEMVVKALLAVAHFSRRLTPADQSPADHEARRARTLLINDILSTNHADTRRQTMGGGLGYLCEVGTLSTFPQIEEPGILALMDHWRSAQQIATCGDRAQVAHGCLSAIELLRETWRPATESYDDDQQRAGMDQRFGMSFTTYRMHKNIGVPVRAEDHTCRIARVAAHALDDDRCRSVFQGALRDLATTSNAIRYNAYRDVVNDAAVHPTSAHLIATDLAIGHFHHPSIWESAVEALACHAATNRQFRLNEPAVQDQFRNRLFTHLVNPPPSFTIRDRRGCWSLWSTAAGLSVSAAQELSGTFQGGSWFTRLGRLKSRAVDKMVAVLHPSEHQDIIDACVRDGTPDAMRLLAKMATKNE